ncbi:alpha/beta hydrolase [Microbacterium abyssi]|uniref:alpha/beta hydrolase n=1 Tax=Microbacterium abyssi TaxID=2782166 RepID=UPI00188905E4|nr:alpha/beta hydrolase [Microbacterium sp. A18JL241]
MTATGSPPQRIEGDVGSMAWWSGQFTRVQDRLEDLRDAVVLAKNVPGAGVSVSAMRDDAERLITTIDADIGEAALLAVVLQGYADAHERHAQRANALVDDIETAQAQWMQRSADAADAAGLAIAVAGAGAGLFTDLAQNVATETAQARDLSWQHLSALRSEYERHFANWDAAYDASLAALAGGASASLTAEARAVFDRLLGADGSAEVRALWNAHPELHDRLLDAHPDVLGNLDGIPWDVRADVNRDRLDAMLATEPPGERRDELEAIQRALEAEGSPRPSLIGFDPDGAEQMTAAIAHGDLATASEINTLVPGMNGNVGDMHAWGESARALNRSVGEGSATVVWFGYDTPNLAEEPGMARAEDGAAALASYLQGLRSLAPDADVNVVAHSYGSTTAALAIGSDPDGAGVTAFIAVGSAGFPDDDAVLANLSDGDPRVYATISEDDAVARIGRGTTFEHSVSPERLAGVTVFGSDGGVDGTGGALPAATGHDALGPGAYLEPGSESFFNVSEIIRTEEPGTQRDGEGSTQGFWDESNWWISDEYAFIDF